jgi:glycosyltransferase involved in cell wall biosynthesis
MSVYNGARYLAESMDSVLSQDGCDFEFIIVNDGSRDASRDILAQYERQDSRVRVLDQENSGLTRALIRGCAAARGELIARQDADDVSLPGRLQQLVRCLDACPTAAFASSWGYYVGPEGELVEAVTRPSDPELATAQLLHQRTGPPAHGSVMFRRQAYEAVGGYRREFYYGQDSDLWLRLALAGQICYVPAFLYAWRVSAEAISSARADLQAEFGELGRLCHTARLRGEDESPFLTRARRLCEERMRLGAEAAPNRSSRARTYYRLGTSLGRRGDRRAGRYLWKAIRTNPLHWRAWLRLAALIMHQPRKARCGC